jgi:hypothetical protein
MAKSKGKENDKIKRIFPSMQILEIPSNKIPCISFGGTSRTIDKKESFVRLYEVNQLAHLLHLCKVWLI